MTRLQASAPSGPQGPPLVLHRAKSGEAPGVAAGPAPTPGATGPGRARRPDPSLAAAEGCAHYSRGLRLLAPEGGDLYKLRCKRRTCSYCDRLDSIELATVLVADARRDPPTVAITLTTSDPDLPAALYREGSAQVWRALRRRFGRVEYVAAVEFTTGRAARSGGRRRMHGHHLVKGIPTDAVLEAEGIIRAIWRRVTGAVVVEVAALITPGAAIAYLGLHHRKPQQAPPAGWPGQRVRWSRGYLDRSVAQARAEARRHQVLRRRRWRVQLEAQISGRSARQLMAEEEAIDALRAAITAAGGGWSLLLVEERPEETREPARVRCVIRGTRAVPPVAWRSADPGRGAYGVRPPARMGQGASGEGGAPSCGQAARLMRQATRSDEAAKPPPDR